MTNSTLSTSEGEKLMQKFHNSLPFDKVLWKVDIRGSKAYSEALQKCGILTADEKVSIHKGLDQVASEWSAGTFQCLPTDEDIHMANERRLTELIGDAGRKLHTGRSRNDQVATDIRLWCLETTQTLSTVMKMTINALINRARTSVDIIMPGYTHLQRAQPVRCAHWMLSHAWPLYRDLDRLSDIRKRIDVMPLGSGALAGHAFGLDRLALARELGFSAVSRNSMDATSDRDFVSEIMFCAALTSVHLSKLAEDLVVYSSREFGFVKIPAPYNTGSSLMPQKSNPDAMELVRGKAGRLIGNLNGFLTTLKGLPTCFNKDMQEDKEPLFDSVSNLQDLLRITTGVVESMEINGDAMREALSDDMLATDIAFYLVRKGIPFRTAHGLTRQCVDLAQRENCELSSLSVSQLQSLSSEFGDDITRVFNFEHAVEQYDVIGGTARKAVEEQLEHLEKLLQDR